MPFVEKNLDGFLTAENAESAEKRFTTEDTDLHRSRQRRF
jgi:hypothetical protein